MVVDDIVKDGIHVFCLKNFQIIDCIEINIKVG